MRVSLQGQACLPRRSLAKAGSLANCVGLQPARLPLQKSGRRRCQINHPSWNGRHGGSLPHWRISAALRLISGLLWAAGRRKFFKKIQK
jgi:hypothetical protein